MSPPGGKDTHSKIGTLFCDKKNPSQEQIGVYEAFRRRIVDEDSLINHRTTWHLGIQTILIAVWAAVYTTKPVTFAQTSLMLILNGIGIVVAHTTFITIKSAHSEMKKSIRSHLLQYPKLFYDLGIPKLTGNSVTHSEGHNIPLIISPLCSGFVQFSLLIYTAHNYIRWR